MKKRIIFFDADGTIWHPKKTKYKKHPVWIYLDKRVKNPRDHLILTPSALQTLTRLKKLGLLTVILSTSPRKQKEADARLNDKIKHFKLDKLITEFHATPAKGANKSKGRNIVRILKRRNLSKSSALMVGDSYEWDFEPANRHGIDALLIESDYEPMKTKLKRTIKKLSDIFAYLS